MSKLQKWQIGATAFCLVIGTLLHFTYELSGGNTFVAAFSAVNESTWEHLRMSLPMLMNIGLSGMAFCGTDVGGFGFDCTGELLSRWVQVGTFTPLFRNHSTIGSREQEPWAFDEITEEINISPIL